MRLFIFNGARTLLDSELAGIMLLAIEFNKEKEVTKILKEYNKRKKQGPWGLEKVAELFKGVSKKEIEEKAEKIVKEKLRKDANDFVENLKEKNFTVVFYSSDLVEIAYFVKKELNLDEVIGTELEFKNNICTGKLAKKVDRFIREEKIKQKVQENNLSKEDVIILGDSITALPSKEYGRLIAIKAKDQELINQAEFNVSSLMEILDLI